MVVKTLIKAVWFDDEWKSDEDFIDVCLKKHGIQIEPFQSTNPGLKYLSEKDTKIISMVILNPLTAIKCVSHDLLKSFFISADKLSRAHNNIQPRKIASFFG